MLTLSTKIEHLKKIGPVYLKKLHRLEINTIRDLFFHFPYRYEDFSDTILISELKEEQKATIKGEVAKIKNFRIFKRKLTLTEALIKDESGTIKVVWFNQPYLIETLKQGKIVNISGKLTFAKKVLCFSNPAYEISDYDKETTHTGRLVPIYHETSGLTSRYLRYILKPLMPLTSQITDFLPEKITKEFNLIPLNQAVKQVHFPNNLSSAKKARERLAFNELFLIQLTTLQQKQKLINEKSSNIPFNQKLIKTFVKNLDFKLTDDQRLSAWEIFQDIAKKIPMNRLLNGDVGSGKTIVAIMAALQTAKAGYQTTLMAPTEILAKQHFETFKDFLKKHKLNIALLTGSENIISTAKKEKISRDQLKKQIKQGKIDIVIGTHAIIQKSLSFKNLALAVIDEQHRFGVAQRAALQRKVYEIEDGLPSIPHLLSMTATPIPRTLALTIYGDLDISIIKQMPKNRQKIVTKIVLPKDRQKTYDFIAKQLEQKKQAFIICPLVEESEKMSARDEFADIKSAEQEYKKLSNEIFPQFKTVMLHGRLKSKEKEDIMKKFKDKKADILVSTSVVEVGIDIPNATIMLIEGANRFGLAQLHQFRGRVGRGTAKSYCFLFSDSEISTNNQRLKAVAKCEDGFELAEKDLKIRGPGDFTGTRQWGLPDLVMASLNDLELIKKTRQVAKIVLKNNLLNTELKQKLDEFQKIIHLE